MADAGVCSLDECTREDIPETAPSPVEMVQGPKRAVSGQGP